MASDYGYSMNHEHSAAKNHHFLSAVLERVAVFNMPCIVGGDFNVDVTTLPC